MTVLPMPPDELLSTTRSVRKRLDLTRPVPIELVRECLEVALQAPTGGNSQGWHWVVVTDPSLRTGIAEHYRRSYDAPALRAGGLGAARDPPHVRHGVLLPAAHYTGERFRPARREPLDRVLHLDRW